MSEDITVADYVAGRLVEAGVRHAFGVGGANIEDLFVACQRRRPALSAVLTKHEHGAGTAADGYARVSGGLGVALATSGGGTLNLVHSLAEARASRVPLLAIVGEPPSELQGHGAFQDTSARGGFVDAGEVMRTVTKWAGRVPEPRAVPELLEHALTTALGEPPGPAVLLIAKDHQTARITPPARNEPLTLARGPEPDREALARARELLSDVSVVIVAGDEVRRAGAEDELAGLAERLGALVAVTPDGRDAFDNASPRFVGVAGSMGHPEVGSALASARATLVVGTRLPLLARQGLEATLGERALVSVGREPPFVRGRTSVHVGGDLRRALGELAALLPREPRRGDAAPTGGLAAERAAPRQGDELDSQSALAMLDRHLPPGAVVTVDAGNTGAAGVHSLHVPPGGRWLIAMGMAGMGWSFGGAIGAAFASGRRVVALAGDGAFFMHGFELHTALEHALPITFVVMNNRAHGMCLVRERLLLRTDAGYNEFREARLGAGFGALLPGLLAFDCRTQHELELALAQSFAHAGPSLVAVELAGVEVPPFAAFQAAGGAAFSLLARGRPA